MASPLGNIGNRNEANLSRQEPMPLARRNNQREATELIVEIGTSIFRGFALQLDRRGSNLSAHVLPAGMQRQERDNITTIAIIERNDRDELEEIPVGFQGHLGVFLAPDAEGNIRQTDGRLRGIARDPLRGVSNIPRGYLHRSPYPCYTDRVERKYFLVPANDGFVPVRHSTEPALGNWLDLPSRTKIVYDAYKVRHPSCEGIDYAAHGFVLHGKSWWPIKNGAFQPSFQRITEPYYPNYNQAVVRPETAPVDTAGIGLGAMALAAGTYCLAPPIHSLAGNVVGYSYAASSLGSVNTALATRQAFGSLSSTERTERNSIGARQALHEREGCTQQGVLDNLNLQDSNDFMEHVLRMIETNKTFEVIREFILNHNYVQIHPEHLGKVVLCAATASNDLVLRQLLSCGAISHDSRGQAVIESTDVECIENIQTLLGNNSYITPEHRGLACKKSGA